jgi:hypothetical protein
LLAAGGAGLGLLVAAGVRRAARIAAGFARVEELALDGRILLYTLASIVAVTVLCIAAGDPLDVLAPAACSWVLAALKCRRIRCSGRSSVSGGARCGATRRGSDPQLPRISPSIRASSRVGF